MIKTSYRLNSSHTDLTTLAIRVITAPLESKTRNHQLFPQKTINEMLCILPIHIYLLCTMLSCT